MSISWGTGDLLGVTKLVSHLLTSQLAVHRAHCALLGMGPVS